MADRSGCNFLKQMTMDKSLRNITVSAAVICAASLIAAAQENAANRLDNAGVNTSKTVAGPDPDGIYTLTLESYVSGTTILTTTEERVPVDVVLVLDASGSMVSKFSSKTVWKAEEKGYGYDAVSGGEYYYRWTDGNYYQVKGVRRVHNVMYCWRTWLYFDVGESRYYLKGDGSPIKALNKDNPTFDGYSGRYPKDSSGNNILPQECDYGTSATVVWTGTLYRQETVNVSRMDALQDAVADFVTEIKNDAVSNNLRNTISVVKFADDSFYSDDHLAEGNHKSGGNNVTELVKNFTDVSTDAGAAAVIKAVNSISPSGATAADYGLTLAGEVLAQDVNKIIHSSGDPEYDTGRISTKVVIMFTDGDPNHDNGFDSGIADKTVSKAGILKSQGTIIHTVGVFTTPTDKEKRYMNAVSSNCPDAKTYLDGGTGINNGYFHNAGGDIDLSSIFKSIAHEIKEGGAAVTSLTKSSLILDVIADSFRLPDGFVLDDIKLYTSKAVTDPDGGVTGWETPVPAPNDDAPGARVLRTAEKADGTTDVFVSGFNFSEHWVGKGAPDPVKFVIKIPIVPKKDAVGGEKIDTNTKLSGIYIPDVTGQNSSKYGEAVEEFEIPNVDLPVRILIAKRGLQPGESAIFSISRRPVSDPAAPYAFLTKVLVTGSMTESSPEVVLKGLSPHYIYKIVEGDWSWTYDSTNESGTGMTTEGVNFNPFLFSNTKKPGNVPQNNAEAVVHNVFER